MAGWADEKKHGALVQYLASCHSHHIPFLFSGRQPFSKLLHLELIEPQFTTLRLMYNHARGDEHYIVVSPTELEGVELSHHAGKTGTHSVDSILTASAPDWEINNFCLPKFRELIEKYK